MREDKYSEYEKSIATMEHQKEEIRYNLKKLEEENESLYDFNKRNSEILDDLRADWGASRDLAQIEETMSFLAAKARETNEHRKREWTNEIKRLDREIEECRRQCERTKEEDGEMEE